MTVFSSQSIPSSLLEMSRLPGHRATVQALAHNVRIGVSDPVRRDEVVNLTHRLGFDLSAPEMERQLEIAERAIGADGASPRSGDDVLEANGIRPPAHGRSRQARVRSLVPTTVSLNQDRAADHGTGTAVSCTSKGCDIDHQVEFVGSVQTQLNVWRMGAGFNHGDAGWAGLQVVVSCNFHNATYSTYFCASDSRFNDASWATGSWQGFSGPWSTNNGFTGTKTFRISYSGYYPGYPSIGTGDDHADGGCYHNTSVRADGCWFS